LQYLHIVFSVRGFLLPWTCLPSTPYCKGPVAWDEFNKNIFYLRWRKRTLFSLFLW
jgi:hypothetical protein